MATSLPYTRPEQLLLDFVSRGLVVLSPDSLGIPADIHDVIWSKEMKLFSDRKPVTAVEIPEILEVIRSPGVTATCNRLLGDNYAIVPYTHNSPFVSGAGDQHWHKDDNGPYNSRKHRHHQAVQVEMLYYPQAVLADMGPTATVPYSQYWTFNHEENHDNFAGADHLDFNYQLDGMQREPVSGPNSKYARDDIVNRSTAHDIRLRAAVSDLGWPLVQSFEVGPLDAGSVVLYSHNLLHRGNHRRDAWQNWKKRPRFMWRFWLYRTTEPAGDAVAEINWRNTGVDEMTGIDLSGADDNVRAVWSHQYHWLATGRPVVSRTVSSVKHRRDEAQELFEQLQLKHDGAEPQRIGAAYRLAAIGDSALATDLLGKALHSERENVRRAAIYGLAAVGPPAQSTLIEAAHSPRKWLRKAGVFGLGEACPLTPEILDVVAGRLLEDTSVYVRSVAAGSLGCLGRRAIATGEGCKLIPECLRTLTASLAQENNRLGMNRAQQRSIKFVRPTDESDVCEGIGIDYGIDRFEPVRSAVRENALWSLVILCSHGTRIAGDALDSTIDVLKDVVTNDKNVFCVGFAMDALNRLANSGDTSNSLRTDVADLVRALPLRSWESLALNGFDSTTIASFE